MSASARARASQKYKSRLSLERGNYGPHTGTPMSGTERARRFRECRKADDTRNFSAAANLTSTSTTGIPVLMDVTNEQTIDISIGSATELRDLNISRSEAMQNHWRSADKLFKTVFEVNPFGLSCSVCDRLCTCSKSIDANKIPTLSRSNGFRYPPKRSGLPLLHSISIRLISPRLPFMQIRRLRYEGNYGIVGQAWLRYLVNQPLYKHYDIKIDWSVFDKDMDDYIGLEFQIDSVDPDFAPESEILLAGQHTLLWNEEQCLDIAPGQNSSPINIIYDVHGEELSFPQIYYGVPRQFNLNVRVIPYMMATSEIRRTDRRGATPDHVLYMAMKMLRIRVVEGIYNMFHCVKQTESITRKMLEDRNFMDECIDKNFVFLKSIANFIQYWMTRKKRPICNVAPAWKTNSVFYYQC
ncbi:uncharacterized protein TNCV_1383001 [Trichonephila clavipes]|nr:uncharacterized protein TNCV_1383001 [Trichonephila clavipes]